MHAKFRTYLPYLIIIAVVIAARLIPGTRTIDDAYITFRYARNILAGAGMVYNPGEQVLGTTTPLYTLVLTVFGFLAGGTSAPFPKIALGLNALADSGAAVILILIGKRLELRWAGWAAALIWAVAPYSVTFAIGGMETSFYIFLLLAVWGAYIYQRYTLAALAAGLALLTRPDALILILPLIFDRLLLDPKRRNHPLNKNEFYAFLIPTLSWAAFAFLYFGSPLPLSIAAKAEAYHLGQTAALVRFFQHFATPFMEFDTFGIPVIAVGIFLYPFLFVVGAIRVQKSSPAHWPFFLFPLFYAAAFSIANPLIFRWYLSPVLPFYILVVLTGLETLLDKIFTSRPRFQLWVSPALIVFFPLLLMLNAWQLRPDHGLSNPAPAMAWYQIELLYTQIGKSLASEIEANPEAVIAAGDVGALGYFSYAEILDTVGLMSPITTTYYPLDPELYSEHAYAVPPGVILDLQPDYFVTLELYIRSGLLKDPKFHELYTLRQKIETDIYESDGMLIFELNK